MFLMTEITKHQLELAGQLQEQAQKFFTLYVDTLTSQQNQWIELQRNWLEKTHQAQNEAIENLKSLQKAAVETATAATKK